MMLYQFFYLNPKYKKRKENSKENEKKKIKLKEEYNRVQSIVHSSDNRNPANHVQMYR